MLRQFGILIIVVTLAYLATRCSDEAKVVGVGSSDPTVGPDWLIPVEEIFDGGPGKDGIPALLRPPVSSASDIDYLSDDL